MVDCEPGSHKVRTRPRSHHLSALTGDGMQIHHHVQTIQRTPIQRPLNIRDLLLRNVWLVLGHVVNPVWDRDPHGIQPIVGHPFEIVFRNPRVPVFLEDLLEMDGSVLSKRASGRTNGLTSAHRLLPRIEQNLHSSITWVSLSLPGRPATPKREGSIQFSCEMTATISYLSHNRDIPVATQ